MNEELLIARMVGRIDALTKERDGLMRTLRDEIDENLRLRELSGALPDENITAMTERLIRERDSQREELLRTWFVLKEYGHHPGRTDDRLSDCVRRALGPN